MVLKDGVDGAEEVYEWDGGRRIYGMGEGVCMGWGKEYEWDGGRDGEK